MWKLVHASAQGTSHQRLGQPCQDFALARGIRARGEATLIAACADGAGSAQLADLGARTVCETMVRLVHSALQDGISVRQIDHEEILRWHRETRGVLEAVAQDCGTELNQLACTLLTAVVGERWTAFSQLGDGAIVVQESEDYQAVFWPQPGEYANATLFLTDPDWEEHVQIALFPRVVDEVALLSDGLQALSLRQAERKAHGPFFAPLFQALRATTDADELRLRLQRLLESPRVNERTDDDKTLILAMRCSPDVYAQAV